MNFAEARFWFYLIASLGLALVLRPVLRLAIGRVPALYDRASLACVGLFLLGCVNALTLGIYVFTTLVTYFGVRWVRHYGSRTRYTALAMLVAVQMAPLIYYKYAHFFANEICGLGIPGLMGLLVPVGLSFYTFQLVSFAVDTLVRRQPLPGFIDSLNFGGFFPQIVAGPIERRDNLLPQMEVFRYRWNPADIDSGVRWLVLGLFFKMVLADNVATCFDPSSADNPFQIWLANLIFGLRIYYDFAGYSLVAFGVSRCLGVSLTMNFLSPYCARSLQEFWRRWHVTLSTWFRDYIYFPLGGSRTKFWACNILLVFIVSGVWHGAGWNFIIWGGIHGLVLVLWAASPLKRLRAVPGWFVTQIVVFFAWLSFYETRTGVLLNKMKVLLNPTAYSHAAFVEMVGSIGPNRAMILGFTMLLGAVVTALEWQSLRRGSEYRLFQKTAMVLVMVVFIVLFSPTTKNDFIYFAF